MKFISLIRQKFLDHPGPGLSLLGLVLFIPFLGSVHLFDWDEINFAEVSREMLVLGDYTRAFINYLPFWEKPPLFFWLQVAGMKVFGVGEFAARLPNAITGIISLYLIYDIGNRVSGKRFGMTWGLCYLGSILPNFYFQSGIIDPVFNLFIFLSFWFFVRFVWSKEGGPLSEKEWSKYSLLAISGVFLGFAVLTKGPAAMAILFLTFFVYWVRVRLRWFINPMEFLGYLVVGLLVTFLWYGAETIQNGPWFIQEFITYNIRLFSTEDAGHGGFPGYHFVIVFLGCFPSSIFAIQAFRIKSESLILNRLKFWMISLMLVVLILFSVVQSKIVHYSSMTYFPLTFLAAYTLDHWWKREQALNQISKRLLLGIGIFLGILLAVIPILGMNLDLIIPMVDDPFAVGNMMAKPGWTGLEALGGIGLILAPILFIRYWNKRSYENALISLFLVSAFALKIVISFSVKKVEGHSQAAAIEFFQTLKGKDVYIQPVGYKTYAHYFYAEIQPGQKPLIEDGWEWEDYLFNNEMDKEVYFVSKAGSDWKLIENPDVTLLYEKNGFKFYKKN